MSNQAPIQTSITSFIDNNEGTVIPVGASNKNYSVADLRFANGYSDVDGDVGGIAITSVDSSKGILWFSTDTGITWSKVLGVSASNSLLLGATTNNLLYYQAAQTLTNANYNGTNNAVFTYRAWDQTTGVNGGFADTSDNGGASAFSVTERAVDGVILDINDAPTLTLATTESDINHSLPVKLFNNINAGAGADDTGTNALIKQIVLNVTGIKNGNAEIITISGVDIPLVQTGAGFIALPNSAKCKVAGTATTLTLTLTNDAGWSATGINNQINQLLDSVTYKNVYVTSTVAEMEGQRVITVRSMTDLGAQSTSNNVYAPKNSATFSNLVSKVIIDKTAPNAPVTVSVPENDGIGVTLIEAQDGTVVVVSLDSTNALEGDVISVVVKNLAPIEYTLLGTDILNNSASVTIPQATLQAAGQGTAPVAVTITDAANNTSVPRTVNINLVTENTAPTGAPLITGTPTQGQVLTASSGTLADIDGLGTLSYKWYANGTEISGATASMLTLTQAQVSKTITVSASYTDGQGELETVSSVATAAVANVNDLPTGVPTITGTAMQGQVLTASSIGIADLDGLGTISYKWYANGTEIVGVTGSTLTLTQAQVGNAITVKAGYTDGFGALESVTSVATAIVLDVNDAPSAPSATITVLEDGSKTFAAADFGFTDVDGNTLSAVIISTLPAAGTLKLSGVAVTAGQSIPVASIGNLVYAPAANANGAGYANIGFKVKDNGGVANGGVDTSAAATLTINVTPVNDAPSATSGTLTILEDGSKTFAAADFGFTDVDGNTRSAVIISTLPTVGTLKLSGVAVTAGQSIPVASIGNLVYAPAANANGASYASIGFKVQDNGGVANGGVDVSAAATLTINVTQVNDAPSASSATITVLEDSSKTFAAADFGFTDVDGNTLSAVIISTLPAAGALKLSGVAVTAGQSIPLASIGNLVYAPAANANGTGYASLGFKVQDNGGVANGGVDTSAAATLTINVTPVNDAPSATSGTITILEDGSKTFAAADFGFTDVDGNTRSAVIISTLPTAGTLKLSGVAVTAGQSIPVASIGNLVYAPAANANGAGYTSLDFKVQDNGGVANGGVDISAAATLTINVTPMNDAPSATSSTITILEDGSKTFAAADFGFTDVDGNTLSAVIMSTLPAAGTLKLSGVTVTAGQSIPVASIGNLVYAPAANANGASYASLGFKVQDNGGVANGGVDISAAATLTINVTPVNDAPSATSATITILEDGSKTFAAADFGFTDVDGSTLSAVIISTLPAAGTLKLGGVEVTAGQSIPVASIGNLVYAPAANANGASYASLGFKVQDNGGVVNGGVDTSTAATLTINVTPVNDAPSATSGTITVLEDGSKTFVAADFGFTDVDGNTLSAVIISTLPTAGTLKLSGVAVTAGQSIPVASIGNLVYAPAANANGASYSSLGFKVQDNGGVANGGVDVSASATLTINVTPVNDAPSATSSAITILEDGSKTFAAADFGFTDVDGNTLSAVIISTLTAAGTLKLSGVAVTAGQSIPVASIGNLVYAPAANANGTGYASLGFKVQDNGGVANGGVDISAAATLAINVTPVNDAPSATSSTVTILEDGTKTFAAADFGFTDVDGNTLSAVIISTLPTVGTLKLSGVAVTAGQSIPVASIGNLVYAPAANANGTGYASLGFKVQDNGGVANGGLDISAAATLTINVTPVNDAPSATSSTIAVLEDGSKTFAAADFGFTDVDGNTLSAVIISTLPSVGTLKLSGVAVTAGQSIPVANLGNLVYAPAANANGASYASLGFKVQDNGGVANAGVDISAAATLTINVTPVNDAPSATSSAITILEDGSKTFAAADFGFSDADGNTFSAVIISTLPVAGTLKLSGVAVTVGQNIPVANFGNLVYAPAANASGSSYSSIGFKVQDNGGVANGGVDTSAAATLTINVTPVNDAPTGSVIIGGTVKQGQVLTASNTLADVDGMGTLSYQWYAGGIAISGATATTYTLTQAEVNKAITVSASYTDGGSTFEKVTSAGTVLVVDVNDAPILVNPIPDQTAVMGTAFNYTMPANTFADVDSPTLTYTATALPTWMSFDAATGKFSGTPNSTVDVDVKVIASDGALTASDTFHVGIAPVVNSVAITGATGILNSTLNAGDVVTASVNLSELVNVTGTPQMSLNIGGTTVKANYVSGSGTSVLNFNYTILSTQNDANGISIGANALSLNAGTIKDASGNNATLATALVTDNAGYVVDNTAPTVAVALPAGTVNGARTVTFTFSEAVAGFTNADVSVANGTLSTVTTSNNVVWTATYTPTIAVTAASNVISVTSNSYTDVAGNNGAAGQVSFNLDTSLNGATRTSDGAGVGLTGMTKGVWDSVRVYAYYNPLFVGGTVTVYRGAAVVGTHTVTAGDSGSYTAYLSPYTNSSGGLWTITSSQTGVYSVALTYNGVTKTLPQMYNVGMSTSSNYLSPLVLDLNGDGVQTADISESVVFDLLGTGKKQVTSWVDRHDGLLAIDLNDDGQINSGTELLGSGTQLANGNKAADGWQALTQHDTNMDGHINAADAVFSHLRVWVDANGDSVTDAGELRTMDDVGIVGINLAADDAMVAQNGNYLRGFSSYTTKDGTTHEVVDAWFQTVTTATSVSGNGASEEGEVRSLADTDLALMNLNSDGVQTTPAKGVTESGRSTAELSSGLSILVADVAFDYVSTAPEFVLTGLIVDVLI